MRNAPPCSAPVISSPLSPRPPLSQARTCKVFVDLFLQVAADFAAHGEGGAEGSSGGTVRPSLAEFPWLAVHGQKDGVVPIGKDRLQSSCTPPLSFLLEPLDMLFNAAVKRGLCSRARA